MLKGFYVEARGAELRTALQKLLFRVGGQWNGGKKEVDHLGEKYLLFHNDLRMETGNYGDYKEFERVSLEKAIERILKGVSPKKIRLGELEASVVFEDNEGLIRIETKECDVIFLNETDLNILLREIK